MIPLRLSASSTAAEPFVVRLRIANHDGDEDGGPFDAVLNVDEPGRLVFRSLLGDVEVRDVEAEDVDGDVLFVVPAAGTAHRLIRAASQHNTFLITEQCDQLCVMCSQPPKRHHVDMFPYFEHAARLAPAGATIGISGGEPTLHKNQLLHFLHRALNRRPDLRFHVLTNGQHLDEGDLPTLAQIPRESVLWGVPLYSAEAELHDRIVGKKGAYSRLKATFALLCRAGASVELRTVITKENADNLRGLARFVTTSLPFVAVWAIMQIENIGYGRKNWDRLFYDSSLAFTEIAAALDIVRSRGIPALLYNFPLCTVPEAYRDLAPSTISDWKRRYLPDCEGCLERNRCGGFFEWYPAERGFRQVGLS